MPIYQINLDWKKYENIALGVGWTIAGINLCRGFYSKYTRPNLKKCPTTDIIVKSLNKGIIFGGLWPATGFITFTILVQEAMRMGLNESGEILYPVSNWKYLPEDKICHPIRQPGIRDDNESSESSEDIVTQPETNEVDEVTQLETVEEETVEEESGSIVI
jgi:hypothetical protein